MQKCLEISHFIQDMIKFGSASGFSTQTGERGLKFWAKIFAITAQKRSNTIFNGQVIQRMHEKDILHQLSKKRQQTLKEKNTTYKSYQLMNKQYQIHISNNKTTTIRTLKTGFGLHPIQHQFDNVIINWFEQQYKNQLTNNETIIIQLYTEMTLIDHNNELQRLRAHPNFSNNIGWHDFCWTNYSTTTDNNNIFPNKIACFFECPKENNKKLALVQEVKYQTQQEIDSETLLYKHYTLQNKYNNNSKRYEAKLSTIDIEAITDSLFALQNSTEMTPFSSIDEESHEIISVKFLKEEWPSEFIKLENYLKSKN